MSNSQDRFSFFRLLTCGGIAFLLLGLLLSSSAQADLIYAVRVNALNAAGNGNNYYSNYNFSNTSGQWVTETTNNTKPYTVTSSTIPIMLCDLGAIQTINSIKLDKYGAAGNNVKAMTIDFYDSPALSGTPDYSQTFTNISQSGATLTLDTPTNARFVKFTMTENYGDNRFGVGNVMFNVDSVITPSSGTVNVGTYSGMSVGNLFDKNSDTRWCSANQGANSDYFAHNPDPVFTYNFNSAQKLTGITVQAYNITGNSIKDFQLDFYDANGNKISVKDPSKYSFTMTDSVNTVQNYFSFPSIDGVKSIKMTVTSNFKDVGGGGDRIGFSEVYFNTKKTKAPSTPVLENTPMHEYNIVRPTGASYVYDGSSRSSDSGYPLTNLFDGNGTSSGSVWCTRSTGNGSDYFNKGYSPVIDFDMPSETMYDSFSIWGYFDGYLRSQLTDFILELFDSNNNLVFADEFKITQPLSSANFVTFSLGGNYLFSKARLTALDNGYYWFVSDSGDRVGFAEIAFYQEPYYFANSPDITTTEDWTINGTSKKGVKFTDCEQTTATFNNSVNLNADGTFEIGEGKNLTLAGAVSGDYGFEKTGKGTLTLSGANTYTGMTTVTEGALQLTGDAVQTSGPITVETDGTLEYNIPSGQTEKTTITADNAIVSDGKVIKTGEGTLKIDSAEGSVDVQSLVVSSGRLDMKSYFKGALIIGEELGEGQYTTATFSPGNSIDTLNIDGDFEINPGSTLLMEIGGQTADDNDKLIVSGEFTIADGAIIYLELADMGAFSTGDAFEALIQAGSSDSDYTDAILNALVVGWPFYDLSVTKSGNEYSIHGVYDPNAVPEPSTWGLMVLGVVVLFLLKRVRSEE